MRGSTAGIGNKVVQELLRKFPNAASKTIARIAYRDNPELWSGVESARRAVQRLRGTNGNHNRKHLSNREFQREPRSPGDPFGKIPEGLNPFDAMWSPVTVGGPARTLVLPDIHFPFHDRTVLLTALRYGRARGADHILLNGDIIDCHAVSKYVTDPRRRNFAEELKTTRDFLFSLRDAFPKARIIFKLGNHEERWERYMFCKAPEVLGVEEFEMKFLLRFKDLGIEEVRERRLIRLGQLNVLHGHEYPIRIANPVNAARGLFLRAKAFAMCSHFHQESHHTAKTIEGKQVATWSTGCLCQLRQGYAPFNDWVNGLALVTVESGGKFEVENRFVSGNKVY